MAGLDLNNVEWKLAETLARERREAHAYAILAIMLTPAFIALWWFIVVGVSHYIMPQTDRAAWGGSMAFYTAVNVYLASVGVSVLVAQRGKFDGRWLIGLGIFLVLVAMTYATSVPRLLPSLHGIAYAILGVVFIGLMGQIHVDAEEDKPRSEDPGSYRPLLEVCGFIVTVYAQLVRTLQWRQPLRGDEIRDGAAVLTQLGEGIELSSLTELAPARVVTTLRKLQLIRETDGWLTLTPKGVDFVQNAPVAA